MNDGITFVTSPDRIQCARLDNTKRFNDMVAPRKLDELFAKAGIPMDYCTASEATQAKAVSLDRFAVSILSDDEIEKLLRGNVFADGGAAQALEQRGFGEYLGVKVGEKNKSVVSSEILHTQKHIDGSCVIVPSRICGNKWFNMGLCGAKALSSFVIPDGSTYPGFTQFENSQGGKMVIYAAEDDFGDAFYSTYRIKLLKEICKYLYDGIITVEFPSYGIAAVKTKENKTAVFVSNLTADIANGLTVSAPAGAKKAYMITSDGKCDVLNIDNGAAVLDVSLAIYDCGVIVFEK